MAVHWKGKLFCSSLSHEVRRSRPPSVTVCLIFFCAVARLRQVSIVLALTCHTFVVVARYVLISHAIT